MPEMCSSIGGLIEIDGAGATAPVVRGSSDLTASQPFLADAIRAEWELARGAFGVWLQHAIRVGELLVSAKSVIPHGEWIPWIAENFPFTRQTAAIYMRIAAAPPEQMEGATSISSALKALAATSSADEPPQPSAVPRRFGVRAVNQQRKLVSGIAEKARLIVQLSPHLEMEVVAQIADEEMAAFEQELREARTVLSRLIARTAKP
jgi:hypothetical protein